MYDSVHNFNKYSVSNFNEISSIDSKSNTINKFYKDLVKLYDAKNRGDTTKQKKLMVLKNALLLYYECITMYKKEYEQAFESKDENWTKRHNFKNLKNFGYQADKVNNADKTDKTEKEEDEKDQELMERIKG